MCVFVFFFFKQKTAYEMRISDWSSDVCSSDLAVALDDIEVDRDIDDQRRERGPHRRPGVLAREEAGVQYLDDDIGGQPGDERDDDVRHDRAVGGGELPPDEKGRGEGRRADGERGGGGQG